MLKFVLGFTLLVSSFLSLAGTKFTQEAFDKAQKNEEKIILEFHAPWCPTCRLQSQSFSELEKTGQMKGYTYLVVDYDKEQELKKTLNVQSQGTLVAFKGKKEASRIMGSTDVKSIKFFMEKAFK